MSGGASGIEAEERQLHDTPRRFPFVQLGPDFDEKMREAELDGIVSDPIGDGCRRTVRALGKHLTGARRGCDA